jgi:hypothetical protein
LICRVVLMFTLSGASIQITYNLKHAHYAFYNLPLSWYELSKTAYELRFFESVAGFFLPRARFCAIKRRNSSITHSMYFIHDFLHPVHIALSTEQY